MKITFIIADTWETHLRLTHENEYVPYKKRTVTIELTPEQQERLSVDKVGVNCGVDIFEQIIDCFIENNFQKDTSGRD